MNALTRLGSGVALAAIATVMVAPCLAQPAPAPSAIEQFARLQADLRRAHQSGDAAAYLAVSQTMVSFLNGSPQGVLQLMSAQTYAGQSGAALDSFARFVAMGQASEATLNSKSFDPLRQLPAYQSIHADMALNGVRTSSSEEVFRLKDVAGVPEDIDFDPQSRRFYISTVLGKQILQVDRAGKTRVFAAAPDRWPLMALKVDSRRRVLWATEVALDGYSAAAKKDWGRSAILQFDLRSGRLLHRIEGPAKTALGDMALATDGDPIVSDGEQGGVYRITGAGRHVQRIDAGDFVSPQTTAPLPDGRHLLVPDYVRGIGLLDLKTKQVVWIPTDGKHALSGIDGLYAAGDRLIATQNGTSPERVVQFTLDRTTRRIVAEKIIERATATLGDPTHGVVVDGYFYYIANSGWDCLDEHGVVKPGKTMTAPIIMRGKL